MFCVVHSKENVELPRLTDNFFFHLLITCILCFIDNVRNRVYIDRCEIVNMKGIWIKYAHTWTICRIIGKKCNWHNRFPNHELNNINNYFFSLIAHSKIKEAIDSSRYSRFFCTGITHFYIDLTLIVLFGCKIVLFQCRKNHENNELCSWLPRFLSVCKQFTPTWDGSINGSFFSSCRLFFANWGIIVPK